MDPTPNIVATLISVMKARGPHDPAVRRIVEDHCLRGNIHLMQQATAEYLIAHGMVSSFIPPPTYPLTEDLKERLRASVLEVVNGYLELGGTLLARRHITKASLVLSMIHIWTSLEPLPIANTEDLPSHSQKERNARAAVAAQALKALLDRKHADGAYHTIDEEDLEGFCMEATRIMEQAYRAPDEWIARKLQGEPP